jgi:glycosyltransferase involved in cell wall biosynthesis
VKVLHVITNLQVGGATDNTLTTVAGHSRDRYEVHLAAGVVAEEENYTEWRDRAEDCADRLFIIPEMGRKVRMDRDLRALRALVALMSEYRYDVVHTHCSKAGLLGRLAARLAGGSMVAHTYHAFGWQAADEHGAGGRRWVSRMARSAYLGVEKCAAPLSDALITVSDLNRRTALDVRLAPSEKLTTVHSGIHLVSRQPGQGDLAARLGLDRSRPIVGTVGRLAVQKDPLTFVDAARLVLERRPEVQFVMVGDGPLEDEVRTAVGSESSIRMLGYRDDVSDILGVLDVFVLSSRWEGLGRALTEAVGACVPVAATAVDGIPELVTHGVTGRLSPPGQAAPLADNIVWLLDHPEEADRMAVRAAKRVHEEWGAAKMVSDLERLYERLLRGRGPAARGRGIVGAAQTSS